MSPASQTHIRKRTARIMGRLSSVTRSGSKGIAVGATPPRVDHFVAGRISKFTYGICDSVPYQPFNPEHSKREQLSHLNPAGEKHIPGCFTVMLPRVCHSPLPINPFR